ncbi:MAG: PTS lactose/cellobiose transporter subunit IIA [Floccifex sp.]
MTETEMKILTMISSAGESKTKAFEALTKIMEKDYDGARALLKEAKESDLEAHKVQTEMIQKEMSGASDKAEMSLLMVHAQDHYMTSQLARDLIEKLIDVFEAKEEK